MKRNLLLFCLLSLLFIGCKKDEKQYNLRLVVDGGKYISTISRIANDKRTPISIDTVSGHLDVTIDAVNADDLLLVQVANIGDDAVNLSVHSTGELTDSYTVNKGDRPYHQYYMYIHPSEETQRQLANDMQRQYNEENKALMTTCWASGNSASGLPRFSGLYRVNQLPDGRNWGSFPIDQT